MVAGPVAPVTPAAAAVPAAVVPATAAEDWRAVLVAKEDWRAVLVAATAAEALGSAATVVAVGRADEAARTSVPCSDGCRCPDILSGCNRMTRSSCSSTNHLTSSTDSHAGTRNGHGDWAMLAVAATEAVFRGPWHSSGGALLRRVNHF